METHALLDNDDWKRPISDKDLRKQALKELLFIDKKSTMRCKSCCYEFSNIIFSMDTLRTLRRAACILGVWIFFLSIVAGISYLYFNVVSNILALPFADTLCDNFIWETCHTLVRTGSRDWPDIFNVSLATFVGFIFNFSITMPFLVGVFYYFDPDGCWFVNIWLFMTTFVFVYEPRTRRGEVKIFGVWMYVSWGFLSLYTSLFLSKYTWKFLDSNCKDYENYGLTISSLSEYPAWIYKIESLGLGKGALVNQSLPGTGDNFSSCEFGGMFLIMLLLALIIPVIFVCIVLLIKRYRTIYDRLRQSAVTLYMNTNDDLV